MTDANKEIEKLKKMQMTENLKSKKSKNKDKEKLKK